MKKIKIRSHRRKGRKVKSHIRRTKRRKNFGMGFVSGDKLKDFPENEVLNLKSKDKLIKLRVFEGWNKSDRKPFEITVDKDSNTIIKPSNSPIKKTTEFISDKENVPWSLNLKDETLQKIKVPKAEVSITAYDKDINESGDFHEISIKPNGKVRIVPNKISGKNYWYATVSSMHKMHGSKEEEKSHRKEWEKWRKSVGYED